MEPTTVLPIIALLSLVSVEYGGWALLGFLTGRGNLGEFREKFFRAGHAHAGVLLVLSLVYFLYLDRVLDRGSVDRWVASAPGDHCPVGWLLHPPRAWAAQSEFAGDGSDANRGTPPRCRAGHVGYRPNVMAPSTRKGMKGEI